MNKEWSELNKQVQTALKKRETFDNGIKALLRLRGELSDVLSEFKKELHTEDFSAIPFINADGYHSKTVAYSIWHISRIEDIVANTLIKGGEQVFFSGDFKKRTGSPIVTTGNELVKKQIADFSGKLDLNALYEYFNKVKQSTDELLKSLSFADMKRKVTDTDRERLLALNVVSSDENAFWLVDYWCGKDVRGLIQMPFSRHWIMHVEACLRIKNKITAREDSYADL